jgi:hypothetical protein
MRKSKTLPPPPRNIMSANCTTCGEPIEPRESKRCQGCSNLGVVEPTRWYPQDTLPSDEDSERVV